MKAKWKIKKFDRDLAAKLSGGLGCHPVTAALLSGRNITSKEDAIKFFFPALSHLRQPFSISHMEKAVKRIADAIFNKEKILIFGDYDVDGITSTALFMEFLTYAGAHVSFYIPHRTKEGYDFKADQVLGVVLPKEIDLVITVDCGSTGNEAIKTARDSGIDVIVTDHHTIKELPPAFAVVNPKRADCNAGFGHLAGVGVAFSIIICLRKYLREMNFWHRARPEPNLKNFCDLVALGTISDVVPLIRENRIFAKTGLEIINTGKRPGIRELIKASGIKNEKISGDDISFRLGPRLNAAGRLAHAKTCVELLLTKDVKKAREISQYLNIMNKKRQDTEAGILANILAHIEKHPEILEKKTIVLAHPNWHIGVLGIVASKLTDKFFRPSILISTKNNRGKGSGRSIPGIDLYRALYECSGFLERFGGHKMAAGLTIHPEKIDAFALAFENAVSKTYESHVFSKNIVIDYVLNFDDINDKLIDELENMTPFGEANPEPLFMAEDIKVSSWSIVGKRHRRMVLRQGENSCAKPLNAIWFDADLDNPGESFEKIAFRLKWNRWNGAKTPQIIVEHAV